MQGRIGLMIAATGVTAALVLAGASPAAEAPGVTMVEKWGYPQSAAAIRKDPSVSSPSVSKLRFTTELGNAEVYRVSATVEAGEEPNTTTWLRVDVLGRPNGRFGWVPESALGTLRPQTTRLLIVRNSLRAYLFKGKKRVWSARIGIGKTGTQTPAGRFYVREATKIKQGGGAFGNFAFGTSAYSPGLTDWPGGGVIGIHGTNEPGLIPGRISHGCIRVRNPDMAKLRRLMKVGTPVVIK